jgi:flagellar protein FliJ
MKNTSSFDLLIGITREQSEKTLRRLQALHANLSQGKQKLETLKNFLSEYQHQMLGSTTQGMDVATLNNYRLFLTKLDRAIAQQSDELTVLHSSIDSTQKQLELQERKRLSFEKLQERKLTQQNREETRRLERQLDALCTQRAASKMAGQS